MQRLVDLRKKCGKTQKNMAEILGISRQAYAHYESDKREPDYEMLKKIASYFNVSIDYLLEYEILSPSNDKPSEKNIKVALFGVEEEVTDEMWEEVKKFVDFVKYKKKNEK